MTISVILVDAVTGEPDYDGRDLRGPMAAMWFGKTAAKPLGARSGVAWGTLTDTITVSGTTITIAPHCGVLALQSALEASVYLYANDADETLEHDAAHATQARKDLICALLDDPAESDGSSAPAVTFTITKGAEDGSNVVPATPARSLALAAVNIPASGGGASTITWIAPYAVAAGGIIPVRTDTERDALHTAYPGTTDAPLVIWHKADGTFYYNDGTGWETLGDTSAVEAEIALRARYTYRPADAAALAALTGMREGDLAIQVDTGVTYRYNGAAWVYATPRVRFRGHVAGGETITAAANIAFTVDEDTESAWDAGTKLWTCPVAGTYSIVGSVKTNASGVTSGTGYLQILLNAAALTSTPNFSGAYSGSQVVITTILAVGDTLALRSGGTLVTNNESPAMTSFFLIAQIQT